MRASVQARWSALSLQRESQQDRLPTRTVAANAAAWRQRSARSQPPWLLLQPAADPPPPLAKASGDAPTVAASVDVPTKVDIVIGGIGDTASIERQLQEILKPPSKTDFFQEFLAIQNQQPRNIGFFGTRNMGFMHQQLIEVLAYAMVLTGNHIFTSGATGTNAAVIRGALRAEAPELLTVVLPQSLEKQPVESQELLQQVQNIVTMPQNDGLQLGEASRICNWDIIARVQQVICFAFHDSNLLLETCREARAESKIVTLFYLD